MTAGLSELAQGVLRHERRALARAITLVESSRSEDEDLAVQLLGELMPHHRRGLRIGVSGPPGVGKSSLLEALGMYLVQQGSSPALLLVDPTSQRSGGSVLGDKTRMARLARESRAFVRPSPSGADAGGISRAAGDVLMLCEVFGFAPSFVETVGVGQAEAAVTSVVDILLLLLEPGAGDELQGIKRGLYEWADVVAVNKADGARAELAERTRAEFAAAFGVQRGGAERAPLVLCVSATEGRGIAELWEAIDGRRRALEGSGELELKRQRQRKDELQRRLASALLRDFTRDPSRAAALAAIEARVARGEVLAADAVRQLLQRGSGGRGA